MSAPEAPPPAIWSRHYLAAQIDKALLNPVRAFRLAYLPLLMIYFAYGALGLTAVADSFWVKKSLAMSPAALASLGVWLALPWTIKMVFGELVDTVPILGSQRRVYVYIGGALVAAGLTMLGFAAAGWLSAWKLETVYRLASLLTVVGTVLQDVVADTMTTEVVPRQGADGSPRPKEDIDRDLGMVQVLGRLAVSIGAFSVAGIAGWLAGILPYSTIFFLGLIEPVISVSGAAMVHVAEVEQRPTDWLVLGGGLAYGGVVTILAVAGIPWNQEIIFLFSMAVVCWMLHRVVSELSVETQHRIFFAALVIFVYRAMPGVGQGYTWFTIDRLGFGEAFQGTLGQVGTGLALLGTWLFSDAITRQPVARVLLWLTIVTTALSLPSLGLTLGIQHWTQSHLGFGAHEIALVDTAAASPFAQLSMIPLLTLCAIYAPPKHRATWFALMASLMNLALVAGQLGTKYLNDAIPIARGDYARLPELLTIVLAIGLAVPVTTILVFGRRIR